MWPKDPWFRIRFSPEGEGGSGGEGGGGAGGGGEGGGGAGEGSGGSGGEAGAFDPTQLSPDLRAGLDPKGFKTWDDLGRSYLELESKIGKKGLTLPGEGAEASEWDPVWQALGRPEKPEDYDLGGFKPPEGLQWNEDGQKAMLGVFHEEGLNGRQVKRVMSSYAEIRAAEVKALNDKAAEAVEQTSQELRRTLGSAYDAKLHLANRVAQHAFGKDFEAAKQIRLPDGTFLLDHPLMAKAFMTIGDTIAEDGGVIPAGGGRQTFAMTPEDAAAEIKALKADKEFSEAFLKSNHPEHEAAVKRMTRLQTIVNSAKIA